MVATKATFQGAQVENFSRNLEFFILTTAIDITDNGGDTSTAKKLGQQQNLNKFLQTIMLRCNPAIISIAITTGAAAPTHGSQTMFGTGHSGSQSYWTMKFCIDYPGAFKHASTGAVKLTNVTQAGADAVYHLSNDLSGIAINIGLDEAGNYTWSGSNDFISTTETGSAANRNTFISKTDIL
jgi:hypothetical protein